MTVSIKTKVKINATSQSVFKFLKHLRYHYLWNPHLRNILPVTALKTGTKYETESSLFGIIVKGNNQVTKYIPDRELQIENNTGMIHYTVNYYLKSVPKKGVLVTCTTIVTTEGKALRFTESLLKAIARRELQSDLQALKLAVEHRLV
jgi:hypothetical protein